MALDHRDYYRPYLRKGTSCMLALCGSLHKMKEGMALVVLKYGWAHVRMRVFGGAPLPSFGHITTFAFVFFSRANQAMPPVTSATLRVTCGKSEVPHIMHPVRFVCLVKYHMNMAV